MFVWCIVFFFFKQKTAYEMRISDWSSDVCSSDLDVVAHAVDLVVGEPQVAVGGIEVVADRVADAVGVDLTAGAIGIDADDAADAVLAVELELFGRRRPDERRVGKVCVSTRRSRRAPYHK